MPVGPARAASSRDLRALAALAIGLACGLGAATAAPRLTAWQEIVALTIIKLRHAASPCGFRVDAGQVQALMGSADLDEAALAPSGLSPALRHQADADQDGYAGDRDAACLQAWQRFGSDGAPGLRDLLRR